MLGVLRVAIVAGCALWLAAPGWAQQGPAPGEQIALTAEQERRYARLTNQLRCLVCQNESIAESNAPLARDLRHRVREQLRDGRSDDEIRAYMRDRYGDFVLYKPPLNATTAALWASPIILLAFGGLWLALRMRWSGPDDDDDGDGEESESLPR